MLQLSQESLASCVLLDVRSTILPKLLVDSLALLQMKPRTTIDDFNTGNELAYIFCFVSSNRGEFRSDRFLKQ